MTEGSDPRQVLLIEDDALVAKVTARLLRGQGFEVSAVGTGEAALARLQEGPLPDLVLVDLNLPDWDGRELLARIHSHWGLQGAIVTGGMPPANDTFRWVTKPFKREELVQALHEILTTNG